MVGFSLADVSTGLPSPLNDSASRLVHSGKRRGISALRSSGKSPHSTHCSAAAVIASLTQEASHLTVLVDAAVQEAMLRVPWEVGHWQRLQPKISKTVKAAWCSV